MNKKGIIFTMDALIALTVFMVVVIMVYSTFTPNQSVNIQSSSIYSNAENWLRATDVSDELAGTFLALQQGGDVNSELRNLLEDLPYRANIKIFIKDDEFNTQRYAELTDYDFDSSIILRKSLILSIPKTSGDTTECFLAGVPVFDKHLENQGIQSFEPVVNSTYETIESFETVYRCESCGTDCHIDPLSGDLWCNYPPELNLKTMLSDASYNGFYTDPQDQEIDRMSTPDYENYWIPLDPPANNNWEARFVYSLRMTDSDADVGENYIRTHAEITDYNSGDDSVCYGTTYFEIIKYGIVELEVENK